MRRDKLVAISGLAQLTKTQLHVQYVSGLWARILPSQLLWRVENHAHATNHRFLASFQIELYKEAVFRGRPKLASRPDEYRASSWSWASLEGPTVTARTETGGYLCQVEPVQRGSTPETNHEVAMA